MSYECDSCGWESGGELPDYAVRAGVQTALCPSCGETVGKRENRLDGLARRFQ